MPETLYELPDYELVRRTGFTAAARVYEARAPGGIPKCVKVVPLDRVGPLSEPQRKGLELLLAARHPYIVGIDRIDVGPERVVAVFEWPSGTLREEFRAARSKGLPGIPRRRLIGWLAEAAEGLDYLHAQWRVAHGALRPENLYVFSGHVKLGEFGPLRELEKGADAARGELDAYLGPEPEAAPPAARDQYSLAAVYCELLCGALPYRAATPLELRRLQCEADPDLRGVPLSDWPVLERALHADPRRRFQNCRDFIVALLAAADLGDGESDFDTDDSLPGATILDAGWNVQAAGNDPGAAASASALEDPEFAQLLDAYREERIADAGASAWRSPRSPEPLAAAIALLARRKQWTVLPGERPGAFEYVPQDGGAWRLLGQASPRDAGSLVEFQWKGEEAGRPALADVVRDLGLQPAADLPQRAAPRRPWKGCLTVSSREGPLRALRIVGLGVDISATGVAFWTPMPFLGREVRVQRDGDPAPRHARVARRTPAPPGRPGYIIGLELLDGTFE